jgi:hypothetical protein
MESDPKEQGDAHYLNKFINRGKTYDSYPGRHTGNTTSSGGRPHGEGIWENWRYEKELNKEVEQKLIIDYKKLDVVRQYRKNNLPSSVALVEKPKMNKQEAPKLISATKKKPNILKLINLPDIHKNLYIANSAVFSNIESIKNMYTIINLSTHWKNIKSSDIWEYSNSYYIDKTISPWNQFKTVYNVSYNDTYMKFKEIKEIMDTIMVIMNNNIDKYPVLIVCDKGVNRATSAAVAYAMTEKGFTFDAAIDYIDTVKLRNYTNWDSLTNTSIKNALKLLTVRNNS